MHPLSLTESSKTECIRQLTDGEDTKKHKQQLQITINICKQNCGTCPSSSQEMKQGYSTAARAYIGLEIKAGLVTYDEL